MLEKAKRIKLTIENPGGVDRKAWPITQGVPFADRDLERGSPVRAVGPDGEALPTQSTCLATWNRDLKYVKWLLVDFQCDLGVDETREVYLEYGEGVESPGSVQEVSVEDSEEGVTIDTGALRLSVRKGSPDFLARCELRTEDGGRDVLRGNPGPYLYMRNRSGEVYDSVTASPEPRVVVEDWGPVRGICKHQGVSCDTGWYLSLSVHGSHPCVCGEPGFTDVPYVRIRSESRRARVFGGWDVFPAGSGR